jgi:hypothetical protein
MRRRRGLLGVTRHSPDPAVALGHRLPSMFAFRQWVDAGGLTSYSASLRDMSSLAANYVDRIARGAKPADCRSQQPTKFELVVNLKTAKVPTIPPSTFASAEEVTESPVPLDPADPSRIWTAAMGRRRGRRKRTTAVGAGRVKNVREPRKRRIIFLLPSSDSPSPAFLVFRLSKLRRTFYAQIARGSFRTASVDSCPWPASLGRQGCAGAQIPPTAPLQGRG